MLEFQLKTQIEKTITMPQTYKKCLKNMTADEIKEAVRDKYTQVALEPCGQYNFPVGKKFAEDIGYPKKLLNNAHIGDMIRSSFFYVWNWQNWLQKAQKTSAHTSLIGHKRLMYHIPDMSENNNLFFPLLLEAMR